MSRCVKTLSKSIVIAFFVVVFIKEITANANDLVNQEIKIHQNEINNIKELISKNGKARVIIQMEIFDNILISPIHGISKNSTPEIINNKSSLINNRKIIISDTLKTKQSFLSEKSIKIKRSYSNLPLFISEVNLKQLNLLLSSSWVNNIFLDKKIKPLWTKIKTNDTRKSSNQEKEYLEKNIIDEQKESLEAKLNNSTRNIGANKVWEKGFTGKGQSIVIIDDGVDSQHDMFRNKIISEACFSEKGNENDISLCPNGSISQIGNGAASNCRLIVDACDHGTHVAGIALGNDQNGAIRRGVAYDASLIPIQVFTNINDPDECESEESCTRAYLSSILGALNHVIDLSTNYNIASVNMSLGGSDLFEEYCDDDFRKVTIDTLKSLDIATVISAGNDGAVGSINAPACVSSAVSVSSVVITQPDDQVNQSPLVDLLAPGFNIRSAAFGNNYIFASGTSMAAPHVAGAFALLKSAKPNASIFDIENALKESGIRVTTSNWNWETPRLNLLSAFNLLDNGDIITGTTLLSVFGPSNNKAESFIRIYNSSNIRGSVSGIIIDDSIGEAVSTFNLEIPSNASKQFSFEEIVLLASPQFETNNNPNQLYTLHITSTFRGFTQHILWNPSGNSLTNISGCREGLSNDVRTMGHIHTSLLEDYPSYLFIHNSSQEPDKPNFTVRDASNGSIIGNFTIEENIPSKSTAVIFVSDLIELFGEEPKLGQTYLNVIMDETFNGYAQHMVDNVKASLITNMTPKCNL